MNFIKKTYLRLKREIKFSASNPKSFKEVWSFNSNGIRVISLFILFLTLFSVLVFFIVQSNFVQSYLDGNNISIDRERLEEQNEQILLLTEKISAQEKFIGNIQLILSGKVPANMPMDSVRMINDSLIELEMGSEMTKDEKRIAQKVKEDMSTFSTDKINVLTFFIAPIKGIVSQNFDALTHLGIDIVTKKESTVIACLGGTIIYSGYSNKDGYILIIEHHDGVLSIYKHNQRLMKKAGDKVQLGDPIAIVGNTGENSDGPHLHFELWKDHQAVDPQVFIKFTP